MPSYNVQLVTDTTHGLVINVEATTDATDYRQLEPALDRCKTTLGRLPKQIVADGDFTNHHSVKAAETAGVVFYGSWQEIWRPTDLYPVGEKLTYFAIYNDANGVRRHAYRTAKTVCRSCVSRDQCASKKAQPAGDERLHASKNRLRR